MWLMIAYHCLIFKWNLNWCICAYFSYSMPDGLWYTSSLLIFPPHDKCIYVYFLFTPPPPLTWRGRVLRGVSKNASFFRMLPHYFFLPHDKLSVLFFFLPHPPYWHGGGEYWEVCRKILNFSRCFLTAQSVYNINSWLLLILLKVHK